MTQPPSPVEPTCSLPGGSGSSSAAATTQYDSSKVAANIEAVRVARCRIGSPQGAVHAADRRGPPMYLSIRGGATRGLAPMDGKELLRRYRAGERSFRGIVLVRARLLEADLRHANFTDADLRRVN